MQGTGSKEPSRRSSFRTARQVLETPTLQSSKQHLKPVRHLSPTSVPEAAAPHGGRLPRCPLPPRDHGLAEDGPIAQLHRRPCPAAHVAGHPGGRRVERTQRGSLPRASALDGAPNSPHYFPHSWPQATCLDGPPAGPRLCPLTRNRPGHLMEQLRPRVCAVPASPPAAVGVAGRRGSRRPARGAACLP